MDMSEMRTYKERENLSRISVGMAQSLYIKYDTQSQQDIDIYFHFMIIICCCCVLSFVGAFSMHMLDERREEEEKKPIELPLQLLWAITISRFCAMFFRK